MGQAEVLTVRKHFRCSVGKSCKNSEAGERSMHGQPSVTEGVRSERGSEVRATSRQVGEAESAFWEGIVI